MSEPTLAVLRSGATLRIYRLAGGSACYVGNALEARSHVEDDALVLDVCGSRHLVTWPTCDQCGTQFQRADGGLADESGRYRFCDADCRAEWQHNH